MARTIQKLRLLAGTALASSFAIPVAYASGNAPDKLTIMDLPIYDPLPAKEQYEFLPKDPNTLERGISSVRLFLTEYKQAVDNGIEKVVHKWEVSKAHTMSLIDYIQNDPNILPRLGVITVAGLGGVVAGYKRGVGRRVTYSALGVTSATCLCYPSAVSGAAKYSAGAVTTQSKKLWSAITAPAVVEPELPKPDPVEEVAPPVEAPPVEAPKVEAPAPEAAPAPAFAQVSIESPPPLAELEVQAEPAKDFGQSSKDDDDLYTTRG